MKRRALLWLALLAFGAAGAFSACSVGGDDDDDDNSRDDCETMMGALYDDCGYQIGDMSKDEAIDECVDASEDDFNCVKECYDENEYCDPYAQCVGECVS